MQPATQPADNTPYAFLWQRFAAVTLDEFLTFILFLPYFALQLLETGGTWATVLFIAAAALRYLYFVCFEHGRGQTIGKRMLRIRVRSERRDSLPIPEALIRNIRRFDVLLSLALPEDPTVAGLAGRLAVAFAIFYMACAPICIWLSIRKQRPLDMVAHTIVVRTEPAALGP